MIIKKIASIISFCVAALVTFLPFNFIVGSHAAFFSYATMAIPALGYEHSLFYVILYIFTKSLFSLSIPFVFFLRRLPLVVATLALQKKTFHFFVILPILAMMLFSIHPVGGQVFYYSWYWFIPIGCYFFVQDTMPSRALAASFIAHAIGSVIWLYLGQIPAHVWHGLIPLVIVERLIIAVGMIGYVYLFKAIHLWCESKLLKVIA